MTVDDILSAAKVWATRDVLRKGVKAIYDPAARLARSHSQL